MNKLYRCDPDKNIYCKQRYCYRIGKDCYKTIDKRYKMKLSKRIREFIGGIKWRKKNLKD